MSTLRIHSQYADGTLVAKGQQPRRISSPDSSALGAHSVLRWDTINQRVYQAREFSAAGLPIRDVDMTSPTNANGQLRRDHLPPPHQHRFMINDRAVGVRSGFKRGTAEPLEE